MKTTQCKITALCNQKRGVTKTTTTANLGVGLAMQVKQVLLVDTDPQADLTASLGWRDTDVLPVTLATIMEKAMNDEDVNSKSAILNHNEGVDLMPASIKLSSTEVSLVNGCIINGDKKTPCHGGRQGSGLTLFTYIILSVAIVRIPVTIVRRVTFDFFA